MAKRRKGRIRADLAARNTGRIAAKTVKALAQLVKDAKKMSRDFREGYEREMRRRSRK